MAVLVADRPSRIHAPGPTRQDRPRSARLAGLPGPISGARMGIRIVRCGGSEEGPMSVDTLPRRPVENWEVVRDEWVAAVERIIDDAEAWAREQPWFVHRDRKTITEDRILRGLRADASDPRGAPDP